MPPRIEYQKGEVLGPYKIQYIKEVDPYIGANGYKKRRAEFLCPRCGQKFITQIAHIKSGRTQSCGCYNKERVNQTNSKDLTNKKFGQLLALNPTSERRDHCIVWKCLCDCGNITYVASRDLLSGHTKSCGCIISLGEQKIKTILIQLNYNFISQYSFDDCRNPKTNYLLKFDFYLPNYNCCIEYDGEQHFKDSSGWFNNYSFKELQQRDKVKNDYCKNNNINLIRIPYTDYNKLDEKYLKGLINDIISR